MKLLFANILLICLFNTIMHSQLNNSILSSGEWYKIKIRGTGVYKMSYSELQNLGINVGSLNPCMIKIYGNPNGMLSEMNSDPRPVDLNEMAIWIEGESDSIFDPFDYILFFGQSSTKWEWNNTDSMFVHEKNLYDDYSYYFLTISSGQGKRIQNVASLSSGNNIITDEFDSYFNYEEDLYNLINSGKHWLGDIFNDTIPKLYSFYSPEITPGSDIKIKLRVVARSGVPTEFEINFDSLNALNISHQAVNLFSTTGNYASASTEYGNVPSCQDSINIYIRYNHPNINSTGWLDYLCLNTRRNLVFIPPQMSFRDIKNTGSGNTTRYNIGNITVNEQIWDVTDILNIKNQQFNISGADGWFITETDSLKEYSAFNNTCFLSIDTVFQISNQNLHGLSTADMIIITHPDMFAEAQILENHHETYDNLITHTVDIFDVYNEFSSGRQDITAIRDFIRHIYNKSSGTNNELKYVLLFGDASYDYKDRILSNTNYVPSWQTDQSLSYTTSICSDDFFGLMDNSEGGSDGYLDLGIGRFPVSLKKNAQDVVNKIIDYTTNSFHFGPWRTDLLFIGDDGDVNQHMVQAECHSSLIDSNYQCFNQNKIYLDNYPIIYSPPSQYSCPDAIDSIISKINNGKLIVNYTGHGNDTSLANENIFNVNSVDSLVNLFKLPFFIAATCETNKYDDPQILSLGKSLFLGENKGSIASFSASRLNYSSPNFVMNHSIYEQNLFELDSAGKYPRLGDIIRVAKNNSGSGFNKRTYILFGDPAMTLAIPENKIAFDQINGINANLFNDTIFAGMTVSVIGHIENNQGSILNSFNGTAHYRLFDAAINDSTLGNNGNPIYVFNSQENTLCSGTGSVNNGQFAFDFIMPSGAQMLFSSGKLSVYASDNLTDAMSCYQGLYISQLTGLYTIENFSDIIIYPTVTSDFINIKPAEILNNCSISVFGIDGRQHIDMIINQQGNDNILKINVQSLDKGIYILNINNDQFNKSCKIIKQ
ncbi:MAG: type IX secretion system sortase PorU [Bacteroidota bacterium]